MSTLREAQSVDLSGYAPIAQPETNKPPVSVDEAPRLSVFLRCPLPPTNADPDSLRQFYQGGKVPQTRLLPASQPTFSGSVASTTNVSVNGKAVTQAVAAATNSTPSAPSPNTAITTNVLAPGAQFQGSIQVSKSFTVQQVTVSDLSRVRLYSTQSAQSLDAGRSTTALPANQTQHGIILDVVINDPNSLKWILSPVATGANGDTPQSSTVYVTVDNLGSAARTITAGLIYTDHAAPAPIVTVTVKPSPSAPTGGGRRSLQ